MTKLFRHMMFIPPVDQKYCQLIGQAIITWGVLEHEFDQFIERMLAVSKTPPPAGWRHQKLDKRFTLFDEQAQLCFGQYPRIIAELVRIKTEMGDSQLDRNLLAHGEVSTTFRERGGIALHVEGRYKKQPVVREYDLADLQSLTSKLSGIAGRISILTDEQLDADFAPGWSPQELSALRDFQAGNLPSPAI